nr:hypothetical protein [Aeromonas salmonicida]
MKALDAKLAVFYLVKTTRLKPGWLYQKARKSKRLQSGIRRHQPFGANVIELSGRPLPKFWMQNPLAKLDAAGVTHHARIVLTKAAEQGTPKSGAGTVLIPLQSAEGQKQRQGRHQG